MILRGTEARLGTFSSTLGAGTAAPERRRGGRPEMGPDLRFGAESREKVLVHREHFQAQFLTLEGRSVDKTKVKVCAQAQHATKPANFAFLAPASVHPAALGSCLHQMCV